jgi:putative chitinase
VKAFFDAIRHQFGGKMTQAQVEGCETLIRATDGLPLAWRAYLLATAFHETARTMQPITEYGGRQYFNKYDTGSLAKALGNTPAADGDGFKYRGRGYVQITGRANYGKAARILGIPFMDDPDLALVPEHAAKILVRGCTEGWFTGKKLGDYANYRDMRRVVNGTDKADEIARYARAFEGAFVALGDGITDRPITPPQKPASAPVAPAVPADTPQPFKGFLGALLRLLWALFTKGR